MNKEKIETAVTLLVGIIATGFLFIVFIRHILPVLLPFIIAWGAAFATRGAAERLSKKTKIPERILRLFMAIFLTLAVFGVLAVLIWQITAGLWSFLSDMGEGSRIYDILTAITSPPIFGDGVPPELADKISGAADAMLSEALSWLAGVLSSLVTAVPNALFFVLVTVISIIYFALDLDRINSAVKSLMPKGAVKFFSRLKGGLFKTGKKYIRSYLVIFLLTYSIMLVGFLILGREHAPVLALIISLLDVLPVIGVGTVLVPWSVFELIGQNHALGIGLAVLFLVNLIIRQLAEPKIVGKSLDMHPVLTLLFLYVGYAFFGIGGLITLPLVAVVLGVLFKQKSTAEVGEGSGREGDGSEPRT